MKFTIDRDTLQKRLTNVQGAVDRHPQLPILMNLLVQAKDGTLFFTGTDLELEIETSVALDEIETGSVTVPARKFIDICNALPEQAIVDFNLDDDKVVVSSGRSRFTLSTMDSSQFPTVDEIGDATSFTVSATAFKGLLTRTRFAMANQDVRYYLNGMLLDIAPQRIRAVATDGHRLALSQIQTVTGVDEAKSVIVPRKGIGEISRLIGSREGEIGIRVGSNAIAIDIEDIRFTSKLIEGRYPDYGRVIPDASKCDKKIKVDRQTFRQCLERVAVLSRDKARAVWMNFGSGILKFKTEETVEREVAEDEMEIDYDGPEFKIGFNIGYILDSLSEIQDDHVDIFLTDATSSCLIQPHDDTDSQYVVMPMRI
ncbi:DNA polymerase III subunit beta [Thioalkalivibrio sp. HK1]|uniref:DNA polymerase III subunit beta n=1 Tax=Thioalkalivibrio sp. HK1 TaxID=1469245 RepID=UPI000470B03A|nr:DNA polymerase III subunit beta [Thioalkalivibrio sp. HK1]